MIVTNKERSNIMNSEELSNYFSDIILAYHRPLITADLFSKQEGLIEELIQQVKQKFQSLTSTSPNANENWSTIEHVFHTQLLGLVEDRSYNELKSKLYEFSQAVASTILDC